MEWAGKEQEFFKFVKRVTQQISIAAAVSHSNLATSPISRVGTSW